MFHRFTKQSAIIAIIAAVIAPDLICLPAHCLVTSTAKSQDATSKAEPKPQPKPQPKPTHRSSVTVATLHLYGKVDDIRVDGALRHLLKSAFNPDSPFDTPDVENLTAATVNLDIAENLAASLIQQAKFDDQQLKLLDQSYITIGNLSRQNILHMTKGNAIFAPEKNIIVLTDLAEIHIGSGSVVCLLKPAADIISVYDLHDSAKKKVYIKSKESIIRLSPGKQITLCQDAPEFEKVNPARRIAYRSLKKSTWQSRLTVYSTEFSVPSAILHIKPLQTILLSQDKKDKRFTDKLLKDYIIRENITEPSEPYKMPVTTALAPSVQKIAANDK